jgi:type IV pilus assembly protein PilA
MNTVRGKTIPNLLSKNSRPCLDHIMGITLIELIIIISIIAIILTLGLPIYSNYTIRAKVGKALTVGATAKTATTEACQSKPDITTLTTDRADYLFKVSYHVEMLDISGSCTRPVITITTRNTGATISPVLILTGEPGPTGNQFSWTCTTMNGQNGLVPKSCRN